jgi:hypothetical protein
MALSSRVRYRIRHNKLLREMRLKYKTKDMLTIAFLEQSQRTDIDFGEVFYPTLATVAPVR